MSFEFSYKFENKLVNFYEEKAYSNVDLDCIKSLDQLGKNWYFNTIV